MAWQVLPGIVSYVERLCTGTVQTDQSRLPINYEVLECSQLSPGFLLMKLRRSEATHVLLFLFEVLCVQGRFMLQPLFIDLYFSL